MPKKRMGVDHCIVQSSQIIVKWYSYYLPMVLMRVLKTAGTGLLWI